MMHANLPFTVDKRVESRLPVVIAGCFRRSGSLYRDLEFKDLSPNGFRMQTLTHLEIGELLWVQMPRIGTMPAIVRWQKKDEYGCEFRVPISKAVAYMQDKGCDA